MRRRPASPDLPIDIDVDNPRAAWTPGPRSLAGLHYLLPIGTLIWCLMVEEMSPSLSAFWAIVVLVVLMLTHKRWLIEFFTALAARRRQLAHRLRRCHAAASPTARAT